MTGLFGRWFQHRPPVEDRVWADTGASAAGLRRQVVQALAAGSAVLLLVRTRTDRENLAHELAAHAPLVGGDRFATDDLRRHLRTPAALGVACVDDLRDTGATTASGNPAPLQVHVLGRGPRRGDDRRLADLLDPSLARRRPAAHPCRQAAAAAAQARLAARRGHHQPFPHARDRTRPTPLMR